MDDFTFLPLDSVSVPPVGAGLLPSISQTQRVIDSLSLRGPAPVGGAATARALESGAAMGLGALCSGAAEAHGWAASTLGIAGALIAAAGIFSGNPLVSRFGEGLAAPALARIGRSMFAPSSPSSAPTTTTTATTAP